MTRQHTTIQEHSSVPSWLMGRTDARKLQASNGLDYEAYRACRGRGQIPVRLAQRYMNLVNQGMGTYTDSQGTAWYRDGDTIVRVTDDLSWIDQRTAQEMPSPKRSHRAAQTQIKDNTENKETQSTIPSSSGDFELPQGERRRWVTRKRKRPVGV